jgi:NitT/TauT family transport system substrate-binding protein
MSSRAFRRAPISRRSFLKSSALTAGTLALPLAPFRARAAVPLKPVTMTLDWLYEGTNVGFLVAHEQGYFREAGLDVAVSSGKGSGSTAQLVASKATQIGFSDGYVVGNGIAKGMTITHPSAI